MDRDHQACSEPQRTFRDCELLEERWRAIGVDGRIVGCSIYRLPDGGFEVRLGCAIGDFQRIRHAANLADGHQMAEAWRQMALAQGLTELSV
jgi:hypothetical protein